MEFISHKEFGSALFSVQYLLRVLADGCPELRAWAGFSIEIDLINM